MKAARIRILNVKIYKIFIYLITSILIVWGLAIIFKSCSGSGKVIDIPLAYLKDDNCDVDNLVGGWFSFPDGFESLTPIDTRIFLHATSCKGGLTSRQACSVESAARAHPNWSVEVTFVGPINAIFEKGYLFQALQKLENIKYSSIDLTNYVYGTPMEVLNLEDLLMETYEHNLADVLKYLTLYKYGGVYVDMDFIVVKSFDDLGKNWAGKPYPDKLGADVFSFSNDALGRMIANVTIHEVVTQERLFENRGSVALTRAMEKLCSTTNIANMSAKTCRGFKFYGQSDFYPISYEDVDTFFTANINPNLNVHAHRMWTDITGLSKFPVNSVIIKLAKLFCPTVYDLYGDDFGI